MEVDWGSKLRVSSVVDWGAHETHPNGHNISAVDWGGHDSSSNHMNEFLLSEGDWGAHDSSFFLFLVNIDAKPKEYFIQGLWGKLQQGTSSTPPIQYMIDFLDTGQTEDDVFNSIPIDPELDDSEQFVGESIQPYLTLVDELQWLVSPGRLAIHAQVTTLSKFRSTPRKLQRIYGYAKRTISSIESSLNTISVTYRASTGDT